MCDWHDPITYLAITAILLIVMRAGLQMWKLNLEVRWSKVKKAKPS